MLPKEQVRPSPLTGRYLFHNRWLRWGMHLVDGLIALWPQRRQPLPAAPRRILLCQPAHIGDLILATSVIPVLRRAYPDAEIGFLIHPVAREVLAGNPDVRWIHEATHWRLSRAGTGLLHKLQAWRRSRGQALQQIREVGYDVAIDLYPYFPNVIPMLWAARIPCRIGWTSGGFGGLLTHARDWAMAPTDHIVHAHLALLSALPACEAHRALAKPSLHGAAGSAAEWQALARQHGVPETYLAIHVGAGAPHKMWPIAKWKELLDRLGEAGHSFVLLGHGTVETDICAQLSQERRNTINLSGKLSWQHMSQAIRHADGLVALDSASGHVAAAWHVPVVVIAPGIVRAEAWKPFSPTTQVLSHEVACAPCHQSTGCAGMECLRDLDAHRVGAALNFIQGDSTIRLVPNGRSSPVKTSDPADRDQDSRTSNTELLQMPENQ